MSASTSLTMEDMERAHRRMQAEGHEADVQQDMRREYERLSIERALSPRREAEEQMGPWTTDPQPQEIRVTQGADGQPRYTHRQADDYEMRIDGSVRGMELDMVILDEAGPVPQGVMREPEPTFDNLGDALLYKYNGAKYGTVGKRIKPKRKRRPSDYSHLVTSV